MKRSRNPICLVAPLISVLLCQSACSTGGPDDPFIRPSITLSQYEVELATGQTAIVSANLWDSFGKPYEANWSVKTPTGQIQDPVLNPRKGSTTSIAITADGVYKEEAGSRVTANLVDPVQIVLIAQPIDPKFREDTATIDVVVKPIRVAVNARTVSVNLGQSIGR